VSHLEAWHSQFVRRHNFEVKTIRCDNGGENKNWRFLDFLNHISANQEFTNPYYSQSNGIAERAHQTLWSITKTLLKDSDLPKAAWGEIVRTAAYISKLKSTLVVPNF
jgi:transposase InsO family protein